MDLENFMQKKKAKIVRTFMVNPDTIEHMIKLTVLNQKQTNKKHKTTTTKKNKTTTNTTETNVLKMDKEIIRIIYIPVIQVVF